MDCKELDGFKLKQQSTTEILIWDKRAQVHREDWAIICNIQSSFYGMILKWSGLEKHSSSWGFPAQKDAFDITWHLGSSQFSNRRDDSSELNFTKLAMECDSAHFWPSLSPLAILGSLPFFLPSAEFVSPLLPLLPILPRLPRLPAASRSFHPLLPLLTTHFYQTLSNLLAAQKSYTLKKKRHTKTLLIKNVKVWKFMWKRVDLWNIMCHNVHVLSPWRQCGPKIGPTTHYLLV